MKRLSLKELQETEIQIMKALDRFCREKGIEYSLGAGSMIGAVRHGGFIPWDDDIDVFMLRKEYNKLLAAARKNPYFMGQNYKLFFPNENDYYYTFVKIVDTSTKITERNMRQINDMGVWIDIFPIDYICDNKEEAIAEAKRCVEARAKIIKANTHRNYGKLKSKLINLLYTGYRITNYKETEKLQKFVQRFSENDYREFAGTICWATNIYDCYPSKCFNEYMDIKFENETFKIFADYDAILSHRYGNYMELPPKENRICHEPLAYVR